MNRNERLRRKCGHPVINITVSDKMIDIIRDEAIEEIGCFFEDEGVKAVNSEAELSLVERLTLAYLKIHIGVNEIGDELDHKALIKEANREEEKVHKDLMFYIERLKDEA